MNPYIQYMYSYPHKTAYRPLEPIRLQDYARYLSGKNHGLYLHIPFCQSKCGYCNLFSVTGQSTEAFALYLDAVTRQAEQYRAIFSDIRPEFSDIPIGGGTPLLLPAEQLKRMFLVLETCFRYETGRTLTIETAPNQTSREKLQILQQARVTRISMGIQSFSDRELKTLGRRHDAKTARKALDLLKSCRFPCINADFIYGIPGQSTESLLASLKEAVRFAPDEIFLYPLYLHRGAWLAGVSSDLPKPDETYRQYLEASACLKSEGYRQDSMRRFVKARPTGSPRAFSECGFGTSLALGCGGRSYLGNLHFCTPYAVTAPECLRQLNAFMHTEDFSAVTHGVLLSEEEQKRRYIIRHLFLAPGLPLGRYQKHFGTDARQEFPLLTEWLQKGYARKTEANADEFLTLSENGIGLSDYLGPQLISAPILEKMKEWEAIHDRKHTHIPGQPKKL